MEVLVVILNDNNVSEATGIVSWSQDTEQWTYSVSDSNVEAVFRVVKERGYALQRVSVQTARAIIDAMQKVGPENEGFLHALEDELSLKTRFLEFRDASTEQPLERRPKSPEKESPLGEEPRHETPAPPGPPPRPGTVWVPSKRRWMRPNRIE